MSKLSLLILPLVALIPRLAHAGVDECGGLHVDASASCEVLLAGSCEASCDLDAVLASCAASLAAACSLECNFDADISCTGDCGATCEDRCRVEDLVCERGCIDECSATCVETCGEAEDPKQCRASCEATCDTDCDSKCSELPPDASCVEHCNQCCFGSCTAQVNMDCQLGCQAEGFVGCKDAALEQCNGSCEGRGSLFCDGQFVVAGSDVIDCAQALERRGIAVAWDVDEDSTVDLDVDEPELGGDGFCHIAEPGENAAILTSLLLLGLVHRRRSSRPAA